MRSVVEPNVLLDPFPFIVVKHYALKPTILEFFVEQTSHYQRMGTMLDKAGFEDAAV